MPTKLILIALALSGFGCSSGQTLTAQFSDVDGLQAGDRVTMAGVEVGSVKHIGVIDGRAEVVMEIDDGQDVTLHQGACARLESSIGSRTVTLDSGEQGEFDAAYLSECPQSLVDRAAQLQGAAVRAITSGAREAAHQLTMTAAEFSQGLNDGSDDLRETGSNLTMAGRAFAEGVEEGSR